MNKDLSIDEFDALEQIGCLSKHGKLSVCIMRNAKRLCGIKYASYRKDGQLELTDGGRQVLFAKQCIDGLRAVAADPHSQLSAEVAGFLNKKGYIVTGADGAQISSRGLECLADIDLRQS